MGGGEGGWGGVEGVGGGLTPPVDTLGLAVGHRSIHTGHRGHWKAYIGDDFTELQETRALLVLPTGLKAHVMNIRGLTGPRTSRVKSRPGHIHLFYQCAMEVYGCS